MKVARSRLEEVRSPLDAYDAVIARRSVRSYKPDRIKDADLRKILQAARQAPSGKNAQPWHFVVVRDPEVKARVAEACAGQTWMADADVIVAAGGIASVSPTWYIVDPTIALENLVLVATSLGYGTCWIGAFSESCVKAVLGIPPDVTVIALTPVGVPAEKPPAQSRRPLSEIMSIDRYGEPLHL